MFEQFGGKVTSAEKEKLSQSPQWDGKKFINQIPTGMDISLKEFPSLLYQNFKGRSARAPQKDLGFIPFDRSKIVGKQPQFAWFGHSALFLQLEGLNLLIDPMLGPDASPIGPLRTRRYSQNTLSLIDALPEIDAIFLTHDHYDHLDYASIQLLKRKTNRYFVALGVKRHLESWGIPSAQIQEFDWWDEGKIDQVKFTFTPSRHFSGRGLTDRAKSLWGGWIFQTQSHQIYWSGDGGFGPHFEEVGRRFGASDWGFMECGQYHTLWQQIHMLPEEAAQAAQLSKIKQAIPVHWAGFTLALHHWTDPVERFLAESIKVRQEILTPQIGAIIEIGTIHQEKWWREIN